MAIDYTNISIHFASNGYEWRKSDGTTTIPTPAEVEEIADRLKTALDNFGEDECQITMGRLLMQKSTGSYDLYVYHGSLDED